MRMVCSGAGISENKLWNGVPGGKARLSGHKTKSVRRVTEKEMMIGFEVFACFMMLQALPGVLSATASLETGIVTVTAAADDQLQAAAVQLPAVVQAIEGLGFAAEPYFPQEEVPKTAE